MTDTEKISFYIPKRLKDELDEYRKSVGYKKRAEVIRHAIWLLLSRAGTQSLPNENGTGNQ